jgi:hypothetical protein
VQPIPITVPDVGTCALSIDTTHGALPDIQLDLTDSVVIDLQTGRGATGPTVVTVTGLEGLEP